MSGHVFITRGDLTRLSCDAWLLPTSARVHVTRGWRSRLNDRQVRKLEELQPELPEAWRRYGGRVLPLNPDEKSHEAPRIWLVNVGGRSDTAVEWYIEGVRQFLDVVARDLPRHPLNGRALPLVALPVVGTGRGGAAARKGGVLQELMRVLHQEVRRRPFDIALVTDSDEMFAAAQWVRKRLEPDLSGGADAAAPWSELNEHLHRQALQLARHARRGNLVLFLGAGISLGAGLPDWAGLLEMLSHEAHLREHERRALRQLHPLDQARILKGRIEAEGGNLAQAIVSRFRVDRYALVHSLLASLHVDESVTTNYDRLFERASRHANHSVAVLPYHPPTTRRPWLLKLHGCVRHPEDIVLTREDYMRYDDRRAALAGIVQALLITRHMLFVGFSLSDDNFHRIADDVRKELQPIGQAHAEAKSFGTALLLEGQPLLAELWTADLNFVSMIDNHDSEGTPRAVRRLEIFLDLVLASATDNSHHLLNPAFGDMLSSGDRELRDALIAFRDGLPAGAKRTEAWRAVSQLLAELGDRPGEPDSPPHYSRP